MADWVYLAVTDASSGNILLTMTGPLTTGDIMDYVPLTTPIEAPTINVSTALRVSWPYNLAQYTLEGAATPNGDWQPVNGWVIDAGGEHQVFLPLDSPMKFFRVVETQ